MPFTVYPVFPDFAAEIGDLDLSQPLSPEDLQAVKEAFATYGVLIFTQQTLTEDQHIAFARQLGPLETSIAVYRKDMRLRLRPEIADVSNVQDTDELWDEGSRNRMFSLGNRIWHTDSSFRYLPAYASILYARSVAPIGGHTQYADMRAAYDALSEEMKARLDGLIAEHSIFHSRARIGFTDFSEEERAKLPPVPQVMVRTLPDSGRRSLYIASHAGRVLGIPDAEGRALIDELLAHATQRQFIYTHRWRAGDLVMWDDRCTMHRGTDYDDLRWRRDFQRATVSDVANTCEQAGISVLPAETGAA